MESLLTTIADYLWTQSWQIALLIVAVALATWALRNRSAHVRYLLWLLVLAKCLTPPVVQVPLTVLPDKTPAAIAPMASAAPLLETATESPNRETPRPALTPATAVPPRLDTRQWLAVGWLAGVAVFTCIALTKAVRTILWLRRERRALPRTSGDSFDETFRSLGVKRPPRVWLIDGVGQPFVWGILRGDIYLPNRFAGIEDDEHRRDILAHEISHVLRFDAAVNLLQIIAQGVFWFHPLLWWANQRIRREREKCCDEMAIAHLGARPKDYSAAIIRTLIQAQESTRPVPSLAVAGPVRNIEERIRAMLKPGKEFYKHPSFPVVAVVVVMSLLAVPTTVVLTVRAGDLPPTDSAGADRIFGNPTNLGSTVNSSAQDYDPSISADELELYFNSYRPGGLGEADLWVTTRETKADPWGSPVNLGPTVNSPAGDKAPCISADGLSLYFSSARSGGYGEQDLWVTTRKTKSAPWGEPVNLGPMVNGPATEQTPSISADGLALYFIVWSDSSPGGWDQSDLWVTTRKTTGQPWGSPVSLGPTVNSSTYDGSPSISADGLSLYFDSERDGGSTIWVTERKSTSDPWETPVKLGRAVNADWEANPDISRDGSTIYFVSTRRGGVGRTDIWQATLGKSTPESKAAQLTASLHGAVKAGDIEQVKLLLSKGAGINATDNQGRTPLHGAAGNGRRDVVQLLLAKGANVDATDTRGQTPLHQASASASDHALKLLLAQGAKVNARDNQGKTPLHMAAFNQETGADFLEFLLAKGADVNARNEQGQTPLHLVSMTRRQDKHREVPAGVLLAHGAEVDATDKTGRTPLHVAAQNGQGKVVVLLLAKGAAVDKKASDGLLALHSAVLGGHKEVVALLLTQPIDKRSNVDAARSSGERPLHDAAKAGYNEIAERLIGKGADVNAKNSRGETPAQLALAQDPPGTVRLLKVKGAEACTIQLAAYLGDLAEVKGYLEKGSRVDAQDGSGLTALHAAAAAGQREVSEYLIVAGADVKAVSGAEGLGTPLHYAAHGGSQEVADLLLLKGGLVNAQNKRGETPLHLAAQRGHTDLCRLLLGGKADVNLRTQNGWTPLHYAADSGQKAAAALLLEKGANIDPKDKFAQTPLNVAASELDIGDGAATASETDVAAAQGHRDVIRFLIDKGANVSSADLLYHVVWRGERELTEILIKKGANVNAVSGSWGGYPVSLYACWSGNPAVLELLLAHGANPNADDGGWSLLHYEVSGDIRTVRMLLDKGANPNNTVDPGGQSPLHRAAELGRQAHVELLIARGADPNIKDCEGRTPLSLAKEKGHNEIVDLLRKHGAKE